MPIKAVFARLAVLATKEEEARKIRDAAGIKLNQIGKAITQLHLKKKALPRGLDGASERRRIDEQITRQESLKYDIKSRRDYDLLQLDKKYANERKG